MAYTLDSLISKLQEIRAGEGVDRPVRMEVSGDQAAIRLVRVEDTDETTTISLVE